MGEKLQSKIIAFVDLSLLIVCFALPYIVNNQPKMSYIEFSRGVVGVKWSIYVLLGNNYKERRSHFVNIALLIGTIISVMAIMLGSV